MSKPTPKPSKEPTNQDVIVKYGLVLKKEGGKYTTYQVLYNPQWSLKEMVKELQAFALYNNAVIRILNVASIDPVHSISLTILPSGIVRMSIMVGFRTGVAVPNAVDILIEELPILKTLVEKAEKVVEQLMQ